MSSKTRTYGVMGVDWEARVDFERLRTERLARAGRMLAESAEQLLVAGQRYWTVSGPLATTREGP